MHNVFLLYMPPGNTEAMVHYEDTIKRRVDLRTIVPHATPDLRSRLTSVFGPNRIAVWGSQAGPKNRQAFDRMQAGDHVLIVEGDTVRFIGKIAAKTRSAELARQLWKPLRGQGGSTWELVYFIANPREVMVPFDEVARLFGYAPGFRLRGLTPLSESRLQAFYEQYDDLYDILLRLQAGDPVARKVLTGAAPSAAVPAEQPAPVDDAEVDRVSDHILMQWKLARLGLKAGERVWVPAGDQSRLTEHFNFTQFDEEFQDGLDLPHSYVENIDVVWKQQFRIGAAFEIENSTAIYSGLLRFADLTILAPNTVYPMFIVAPEQRHNRVRDQLRRPAFKELKLDSKVRFLSYERINEIESFFAESSAGLSVDTIVAKSELVT